MADQSLLLLLTNSESSYLVLAEAIVGYPITESHNLTALERKKGWLSKQRLAQDADNVITGLEIPADLPGCEPSWVSRMKKMYAIIT